MESYAPHPAPASGSRPTRGRYRVLAALCSLAFLSYLDRNCISRVHEDIERDLAFHRLSDADVEDLRLQGVAPDSPAGIELGKSRANTRMGWVYAAFLLGYALFEVPGGWLGDIWGPRRVIFRIVVWWSVFTAATGSVPNLARLLSERPEPWLFLGLMVAVRFLFGLGEAGAFPNIARALGRWYPYGERAGAAGVIWMATRLGGAFSPILVSLLVRIPGPWPGWQQAFWILGGIGILWSAVFFWWFRDRPEEAKFVNDAERLLISSSSAGRGDIYDDRSTERMPWRELVLSPNLAAIYAASFCVSFSFYLYLTFLPKYLQENFAITSERSAWMCSLPLFLGAAACGFGGRLSDRCVRALGKRWGRSVPGMLGFTGAGACILGAMTSDHLGVAVSFFCGAFVFQDLAVPAMWSLPADVGGRYAGTVGGAMNSVGAAGGVLCPILTARLADEFGWKSWIVLLPFTLSYFLGAIAWWRIDAGSRIRFDTLQR